MTTYKHLMSSVCFAPETGTLSAKEILARRKGGQTNGNGKKLDAALSAFIPDFDKQTDAFKNEWRGYVKEDGLEKTKALYADYMQGEADADDDEETEIVRSTEISVSARQTSIGRMATDFAKQMDDAFVQVLRDGVEAEMKRQFSPILALQHFNRCYTKDQLLAAPMVGSTQAMVKYLYGDDTNQPYDTFTVMEPNSEGQNRPVTYSFWEIEYEATPIGSEYRQDISRWETERDKLAKGSNPRLSRYFDAQLRTARKKYNVGFTILKDAFIVLRKMAAVEELPNIGGCVFIKNVDLKTSKETDEILNTPRPIKVWDKVGANDATNPASFSVGTFRRVDVDWARTGKALRPDPNDSNKLIERELRGYDREGNPVEVPLGTVAALQATMQRNVEPNEELKSWPVPTKTDEALTALNALASYYNIEDNESILHVGTLSDMIKSNKKTRKNDEVAAAVHMLWNAFNQIMEVYGDDISQWLSEQEPEETVNPVQALVNKAKAANK